MKLFEYEDFDRVHVWMFERSFQSVVTDLEVLATLFASAVHDIDHPGLTNNYLITTGQSGLKVLNTLIKIQLKVLNSLIKSQLKVLNSLIEE